jgi:hypothetical protein
MPGHGPCRQWRDTGSASAVSRGQLVEHGHLAAPVDANSGNFINFVGGTRKLHPDFGGEASPGSVSIYGMPYAIVDGGQPKLAVTFAYWDESDGVNYATGQGVPFYPIPFAGGDAAALGRRRRARQPWTSARAATGIS